MHLRFLGHQRATLSAETVTQAPFKEPIAICINTLYSFYDYMDIVLLTIYYYHYTFGLVVSKHASFAKRFNNKTDSLVSLNIACFFTNRNRLVKAASYTLDFNAEALFGDSQKLLAAWRSCF